MDGPTRLFADPDYALGSWQNIFLVVWRVHTTFEACERLEEDCRELAKQCPDGIGLLTIIEETAPPPPWNVRKRLAQFLKTAPRVHTSGVAMEGSGFRAATVRSIVSGLTLLARQPFPHRVFSGVDEALTWLAPDLGPRSSTPYDAAQASAAVAEFRADVDRDVPKRAT